jgi:hypothetical protein
LIWISVPGLATRAFDTIVPCAPEIHRAKRGKASPRSSGRSLQLIARPPTIRRNRNIGAALCFRHQRSHDPSSTMNRKPDPYGRDATRPYHIPLKRLVASDSKGVERKQSRQSLGDGGGVRLLRALCHLPRVVGTHLSLYGLAKSSPSLFATFALASATIRAWSKPSVIWRASTHSALVASDPALGKASPGNWVA